MSSVNARPSPSGPAQIPIGPSRERWTAMTEPERQRFYQEIFDAINTQTEAMAEGRPHRRIKSAALDALTRHFKATGRMIYVADELTVVYPGKPVFTPDLLAVLDVAQPDPDEDERLAWVVADEGKGPDLVLEVLHKGHREKDLVDNVDDYAQLGIREYFIYDRLNFKLHGYRLARSGGRYQALRPRLGRLTSEVLGLDLALVERRLRFFSGMGELMNSEEFIERLSTMMDDIEARADRAEAQAAQEHEGRLQEARDAVLDLAESYGVEITAERRQQVMQAELPELRALRAALKTTRVWPGPG